MLSFAGRVTLPKSILLAVPYYSMNTVMLPKSTYEELDQIIWSFIWGNFNGSRKPHLIQSDTVCSPKNMVGLGLRSTHDANLAILLGWRLITHTNGTWGKLLIAKYGLRFCRLPSDSIQTSFRLFIWLEEYKHRFERDCSAGYLLECGEEESNSLLDRLADLWSSAEGWKWHIFSDCLPTSILMKIAAVCPNLCSSFEDTGLPKSTISLVIILIATEHASELNFFLLAPRDWIWASLSGKFSLSRTIPGAVAFAVFLWWLWCWRNGRVFENPFPMEDIKWF
ncbi:LOW QUALITY PROTEIN: hypothetical protein V2J09_018483 [Rumex salicifolius]